MFASEAGPRQVLGTLREDASGEAGCLAGPMLGHVGSAGDRACGAGPLAIEEDHENQCADECESPQHTDNDPCDGAPTQISSARASTVGGRILGARSAWSRDGDGFDEACQGRLHHDHAARCRSRVGCGGLRCHGQ